MSRRRYPRYINYGDAKPTVKPQFPRTEYIVSSKADIAQTKINEFIAMLEEKNWEFVDIKPLISFSGPSLIIGGMILYYQDEEDTNETTNSESGTV